MSKPKIKSFFSSLTFKKVIWIAPVLYLFHIIEEAVFGFYIFMNKYRGGNSTYESFLISNTLIMIVYLILISLFTIYPNRVTAFFNLAGLLAAQFFNAFFHLIMAIEFGAYCPGLITGLVLYIPYNLILVWMAYREEYITKTMGIIAFLIGAILMTLFEIEGLNRIVLFGWPTIVIIITIIYYFRTSKKTE